jgi:hypothetical protein
MTTMTNSELSARRGALMMMTLANIFVSPTAATEDVCAVYIAKASSVRSPIPISFYSGVKMNKGEHVPVPDIGIHLVDFVQQNPQTPLSASFLDIMWTPSELISQYEDMTGEGGLALPSGMAFSGTENPGVCNVRWDHSSVLHRYASKEPTGSLDYRTDALAGAITEHFGLKMITTDDVEEGMEFFPFFGETWFESKEEEASEQPTVFTKASYEKADAILIDFAKLLTKHEEYFTEHTDKAQEYWTLIRDDVVTNPKIRLLLPQEHAKVSEHAATGTAILRNNDIKRPLDYLQTKGTCADNIVQKESTIRGAGRGGFAKRALSKGDDVAPVPLVRFLRESLLMLERDGMNGVKQDSQVVAAQLAMNYVLGHPASNVVFFPYGMGVTLINHAIRGSGRSANVKMVWSDKEYHDKTYLDMDMNDILGKGLSEFVHVMDLVALRDIQEGEEFLLDYGAHFDYELTTFLAQFKPAGAEAAPKASTLNLLNQVFRTKEEQLTNPYPSKIETFCYVDDAAATNIDLTVSSEEDESNPQDGDGETKAVKPKPKMALPDDLTFLNSESDIKIYNISFDALEVECDVLVRDENVPGSDEPLYLVRLIHGHENEDKPYVVDMPQSSIIFLDQEYNSAMHNPEAFRHFIEIPTDIFPSGWMNSDDEEDDEEDEDKYE